MPYLSRVVNIQRFWTQQSWNTHPENFFGGVFTPGEEAKFLFMPGIWTPKTCFTLGLENNRKNIPDNSGKYSPKKRFPEAKSLFPTIGLGAHIFG